MASRLPSAVLEADHAALLALKDLQDYQTFNPASTIDTLTSLEAELVRAQDATLRARKTLAAARDAEIAAGRAFHAGVLAGKAAVIAQYGGDSPAVQAIGLKKKSERKRPVRRVLRGDAEKQQA